MSMTWATVVAQARFLLQDTREGEYRISDADLAAGCYFACITAKQTRPDMFFGHNRLEGDYSPCFPPPPYTDATALATMLATECPVPENYVQAVVMFIAGWGEMANEEFAGTDRARTLMASFASQLRGSSPT